jgi:hypothetical protein
MPDTSDFDATNLSADDPVITVLYRIASLVGQIAEYFTSAYVCRSHEWHTRAIQQDLKFLIVRSIPRIASIK